MASIATQRAILTLSYVESLCISLKEWYRARGRKSERLFSLCDRLAAESCTALRLYPDLTAREVRVLEAKIHYLNQWINEQQGTDATVGTSLVLGMVIDLRSYCAGTPRAASLDRMHGLLGQIHRYFDRKEQKEEEYQKAWLAMGVHERLLSARAYVRPSRTNPARRAWFLRFEDTNEEVEVIAA